MHRLKIISSVWILLIIELFDFDEQTGLDFNVVSEMLLSGGETKKTLFDTHCQ